MDTQTTLYVILPAIFAGALVIELCVEAVSAWRAHRTPKAGIE